MLYIILLILGGGFYCYDGYTGTQMHARLEAEGTQVDAILEGGEVHRKRRGGSSYQIEVTYQTPQRLVRQKLPVTRSFFETVSAGDSMTVDTVKVKYLESQPESAMVLGGTPSKTPEMWIGMVMLMIGLGWGAFKLVGSGDSEGELTDEGDRPQRNKAAGVRRKPPSSDF